MGPILPKTNISVVRIIELYTKVCRVHANTWLYKINAFLLIVLMENVSKF